MAIQTNHSLWADGHASSQFAPLKESAQFDVAIVGGGFSGLWLAYHLKNADPALSIAIFEARHIGFGASGRNGGWVSAEYPVYRQTLIKRHGEVKTDLLFDSIKDAIDDIGAFATQFAKESNFIKGGSLLFARNLAQVKRLQSYVDGDHRWLSAPEVRAKINISRVHGGVFTPHCASLDPMQLVQGLAKYLSQVGVKIYEDTHVGGIFHGVLMAGTHQVTASMVVTATEAFRKPSRNQIPLYSLMVATEPLSDSIWSELGNQEKSTFAEAKYLVNYAQRTGDNRLAMGGRGARYPFASKLHPSFEQFKSVHSELRELAQSWFPILKGVEFTHAWGGPVAITRDWEPFVRWDSLAGYGELGGYAGDGLTMSYLASKALALQMNGLDSQLNRLHFVNYSSKKWEVEPIRYASVNTLVKLSSLCDTEESFTGKPSRLYKLIAPLASR